VPRSRSKVPSYCLHKASGRAVVRLNGKDIYLGPHGSEESHIKYERAIARWRTENKISAKKEEEISRIDNPGITIEELIFLYREFASEYYVRDGKQTSEFDGMRDALRPVRLLFGNVLGCEFGPRNLKAMQTHMIEVQDLSRKEINKRINRIRRFVRWAIAEELIPPSIIHGLTSLPPLKRGRCNARETKPIKPVLYEHVLPVLDEVSPYVTAMIQTQLWGGMRPGEVVIMRACDIDRSDKVWLYEPATHKNDWREHKRIIPLGPKVQEVLTPLITDNPDEYLFSPIKAEAHRNAQRRAERKSPRTPSQNKRSPKRPKRERYDRDSYAVEPGPAVCIHGQEIGFSISEKTEAIRSEPKEHSLEGSYEFGHSRFVTAHHPSPATTH